MRATLPIRIKVYDFYMDEQDIPSCKRIADVRTREFDFYEISTVGSAEVIFDDGVLLCRIIYSGGIEFFSPETENEIRNKVFNKTALNGLLLSNTYFN